MRLVFLASGEFAAPTLRWLSQSEHEVALVVTQPAKPGGRGRRPTPTPIAVLASQLELPVVEAENVNESTIVERVRSLQARLGLVIAFGQKLRKDLMAAFPAGCINLHASLLPQYRGAAPINWAVIHGEPQTGVTVFRIVERMDAGPILVQRPTPLAAHETAGELHDRLADLGVDAVRESLDLFAAAVPPGTSQDDRQATVARKLTKADGVVDFHRPADAIVRHILGMTPWPGATARYESGDGRWENVTLLRARPVPDASAARVPPGVLDARLHPAAADGFLEILEIKPSSGRRMTWTDYVNGRHVAPGDRFTSPRP